MNESISNSGLMVKSFTVYKFLTLLSSPFSSFDAFRKGIIDTRGNYVKDIDEAFRSGSLDPLEVIIIKLKKIIATSSDPGLKSSLSNNLATFDLFLNEMYQYNVLPHESLYLLETHCLKKGFSLINALLEDTTVGGGGIPGLSITDIIGPKRRKKSKIFRRKELMEMEVGAGLPGADADVPPSQHDNTSGYTNKIRNLHSVNNFDEDGDGVDIGDLWMEFWRLYQELLRQLGDDIPGADGSLVEKIIEILERLKALGEEIPENLLNLQNSDINDDQDNDGIPDHLDNDIDNDGIYNVYDPDSPYWTDENGNGIHDWIEPDHPEDDENGNGIDDALEDSDNNGIPDIFDKDGDGIDDDFEDDDGDGIPNGNDSDDDNNGILDYQELIDRIRQFTAMNNHYK